MWADWHGAASTTLGLFWMAFWAFGLGYLVSSCIQIFVGRERMRKSMGETGPKSVGLGALFGFVSSSCSFAALATTRSLFTKGAGLIPSLAFLLASTNLVIELGIVISMFLGAWFVVGEYVGGILLILLMWLLVKLTCRSRWVDEAREHARGEESGHDHGEGAAGLSLARTREGWARVASRYVMEWHMVWKEVTIGFTLAGVIATLVGDGVFEAMFIGSGEQDPSFGQVFLQVLAGPIAAFLTFIGSMGNIPLAAVLHERGVSFAGVMAFIFSDLVVLPVLRIQAKYYGWRMALYIAAIFFAALVITSLLLHYGLIALGADLGARPEAEIAERQFFAVDYTLFLNAAFIGLSAVFAFWHTRRKPWPKGSDDLGERILFFLACASLVWLVGGTMAALVLPA